MNQEIIETRTAFISLREDGIVFNDCKKDSEHTLADAKENLEAIRKVARITPCPLLVNIKDVKSQSAESRNYYSSDESSKLCRCVALLTGSIISKVIGNFFIGLNKSKIIEVRLFETEDTAVKWLLEYSEKNGR